MNANRHGALLVVDDIRVGYPLAGGLRLVVDGMSLRLQPGEIGCLLGASGCGKTTVLRAIAGFEPVHAGAITLDGVVLSSANASTPPERRGIGMMFQDYALFPHLDVAGNVGFGLVRQSRVIRDARIAEVLSLVGLSGQSSAYPHELSGGQQQRVALARALAPSPKLLLLDEPFSNLDADTRERLAGELRTILRATGITALLVTHDQAEAFAIADHIGVMEAGRIQQWGAAETLFRQPANRFVAGFIGRGTLLPASALGLPGDDEVLLRPDRLLADPAGMIRAELVSIAFRGPARSAQMRLRDGHLVEIDLPLDAHVRVGETVMLRLLDGGLPAFPAATAAGGGAGGGPAGRIR